MSHSVPESMQPVSNRFSAKYNISDSHSTSSISRIDSLAIKRCHDHIMKSRMWYWSYSVVCLQIWEYTPWWMMYFMMARGPLPSLVHQGEGVSVPTVSMNQGSEIRLGRPHLICSTFSIVPKGFQDRCLHLIPRNPLLPDLLAWWCTKAKKDPQTTSWITA